MIQCLARFQPPSYYIEREYELRSQSCTRWNTGGFDGFCSDIYVSLLTALDICGMTFDKFRVRVLFANVYQSDRNDVFGHIVRLLNFLQMMWDVIEHVVASW